MNANPLMPPPFSAIFVLNVKQDVEILSNFAISQRTK
jgi:hypothetical protein